MPTYKTGSGQNIPLGQILGKGGEGNVYISGTDRNLAVKIYHDHLASERKDKIQAMISSAFPGGTYAAFPVDAVYNGSRFCGFTMPVASKRKPIHEAYSPASRKTLFPDANFRFLLRVAANTAIAVNKVHETGCVIGDVNHSGVLVSPDATVTLIDTDSFQFRTSDGTLYPCKVGVPEYTPPELQGKSLSNLTRTQNHDNFGLAVLIFHLLFLGRHPFAGQVTSGDQPTAAEAIQGFRFAYSSRRNETRMAPPPHSVTSRDIPIEMADAFEAAFGPNGVKSRPAAVDWIGILRKAEGFTQKCQTSKSHDYFKNAKACPWCRIEKSIPGFFCFTPVFDQMDSTVALSLKELVAKYRAMPKPHLSAELTRSLPALTLNATKSVEELNKAGKTKQNVGLAIAGIGGFGIAGFASAPPLLCLAAVGAGAVLYFKSSDMKKNSLVRAANIAEQRWNSYQLNWRHQFDTKNYESLKKIGDGLVQISEQLPLEEKQKIDALQQQKRVAQLRQFLSGFRIDKANIKGIGQSRIIMLASRQIETAADIEFNRVRYIKGFGPNLAQDLVNWRRRLEQKLVFNPNAAIDPAEIARVKSETARKQSDTVNKLKSVYHSLGMEVASLNATRPVLNPAALKLWTDFHQTKLDLAEVQKYTHSSHKGIFIASVVTPLFLALSISTRPTHVPSQPPPQQRDKVERNTPTFRVPVNPPTLPPSRVQHGPQSATQTEQPPQQLPQPVPQLSASFPQPTNSVNVPLSTPQSSPTPQVLPVPPLLNPITPGAAPLPEVFVNTVPVFPQAEALPQYPIDTTIAEVASAVQSRLQELGYLRARPDGRFGPMSRQALQEFQLAAKLPIGSMDDATARALYGATAPKAPMPVGPVPTSLRGAWNQEPCDSPTKTSPITLDADKATVFDAACVFESMTNIGNAWRGTAVCTYQRNSWRSDITLRVVGSTLIWSSAKGSKRYFRCTPE